MSVKDGSPAMAAWPHGRVIKAAEAESWVDGFAFRDRARAEADRLLADTTAAYERRRGEGFSQGRREGAAAAAELLAETNAKVDRYLAGIESQIADLALEVVRRVAGELDARDLVARLAAQALDGFRRAQHVTVTVAPENLDAARRALLLGEDPGARVEVISDPALGPLDCRVASPYATVDAGLEAQLSAIREEISDAPERDGG